MANLNAWQKITRVLSGKPFGDGADGAYSSATIPTMKYKTCSGTATSTTLTADTDASPFEVGDILLLHQTRGTGVGQWEINLVLSVGSDQYTLQEALQYTYTDSGASQAQAVVIPRYTDMTVQSGTWTLAAWGGDTGGILPLAANGTTTVTGTMTAKGKGYVKGVGGQALGLDAYCGEGTSGASARQNTANGSGGGGGNNGGGGGGVGSGGGGGHSASGGSGVTGGTGGGTSGSADLITMTFGGAGGAGGGGTGGAGKNGGDGGGIIALFAKNIVVTGSALGGGNDGVNGVKLNGDYLDPGGGGGGGSFLLQCQTATLGATLVTALKGNKGTYPARDAGDGAAGRIAVHHSGAVTGTTSPTFTDVEDSSLVEAAAGGAFLFNMV